MAARGGAALPVATDVTHAVNVEVLVAAAVRRFGRLDCAFNNAGVGGTWAGVHEADKAGLGALMRAAALEAGPRGVRLNTVRRGVTDTPMFRRGGGSDAVAGPIVAHAPLGRLGTPEDVAAAAAWLCTDEARFVTGQASVIDGGFTIAGARWRAAERSRTLPHAGATSRSYGFRRFTGRGRSAGATWPWRP